jgi:hypothetical protein
MNHDILPTLRIAALCARATLQACGGSDGGGESPSPAPSAPSPPPSSGLDPSFGSAGKATLEAFGGGRSGMALQADGKVTTDMGSGLRQEEALAVAIQGDGKIVVGGLARNNVDGYGVARINP